MTPTQYGVRSAAPPGVCSTVKQYTSATIGAKGYIMYFPAAKANPHEIQVDAVLKHRPQVFC